MVLEHIHIKTTPIKNFNSFRDSLKNKLEKHFEEPVLGYKRTIEWVIYQVTLSNGRQIKCNIKINF